MTTKPTTIEIARAIQQLMDSGRAARAIHQRPAQHVPGRH